MGRITRNRGKPRMLILVYVLSVTSMSMTLLGIRTAVMNFEDNRDADTSGNHNTIDGNAKLVSWDTVRNDSADVKGQGFKVMKSRSLRDYDLPTPDRPLNMDLKPRKFAIHSPVKSRKIGVTAKPYGRKNSPGPEYKKSSPLHVFYTPPEASGVNQRGRDFNVSDPDLVLPPSEYMDMNSGTRGMFTIVTWADPARYEAVRDRIGVLQHGFIGHNIVVYDIGLEEEQRSELKTFCHVAIRRFDMYLYPDHVSNISTYAFRPVIFREALMEFTIILWLEADFALPPNRIQWQNIYSMANRNLGWVQIKAPPTQSPPQGVQLHPDFMEYIPNKMSIQNRTRFVESGAILAYNSEHVYRTIVHWWYACALDKRCFTSVSSTSKCGTKPRTVQHLCRHNDQTILDVLVTNSYGYDMSVYSMFYNVLYVKSKLSEKQNVKKC